VEQRARRGQPALVEQRLGQRLGVAADVDPAEQARRRRDEAAARRQRVAHAAGAGGLEPRRHPLGVAAQQALLQAQRDGIFERPRRRQRGQQLGVDQALGQRRRRGQEAHPPLRREDLREARDQHRAPQAVELGQAGGVRRREPGVGVVLDDRQLMRVGELQDLVRAGRRQAGTGGVVQHAHRHVQVRTVLAQQRRHHRQIGAAVAAARQRQQPHAQARQPRILDRPARLVDEHRVAGLQQRAADEIERLRGADRGHDLLRAGHHAEVGQALLNSRSALQMA
jgi:hypothetical protein